MKYTDALVYPHEKRLFDAIAPCFKHWTGTKRNTHVGLILHCLPHGLEFCIVENMVARKICGNSGINYVSIQYGMYRKATEQLDRSFGIEPLFIEWEKSVAEPERNFISETMERFLETADPRKTFHYLTYRGIRYGDVLYDQLLRLGFLSQDGKRFVPSKNVFKTFSLAFHIIDRAYDFFEKNDCSYIVLSEWLYLNGMFARVGQEFGAEIFVIDVLRPKLVAHITPDRKLFDDIIWADMIKAKGDLDFPIGRIEKDLFVVKRDDWRESNCLRNNGKPNVFILLHAISDAPHAGAHMNLFYDYYEWLIFTLNAIKDMKHINWYIKDHPESRFYNQENTVKEVFEKYSGTNLFWCDKNVSGGQLVSMADCVVTCAGDAGIEFWAYGIPTISAAKAYYVDWGISYSPDTKEDYVKLLDSAGRLEKPSQESIKNAKKKLICAHKYYDDDRIEKIFFEARNKMVQAYRYGSRTLDISYEFAENLRNVGFGLEYDLFELKIFDVI